MDFARTTTLQQLIDELSGLVWNKRHPDRPIPSSYAHYAGDPEWNAIRSTVREAVLGLAEQDTTSPEVLPAPDAEWKEQQRLALIGARAFSQLGF